MSERDIVKRLLDDDRPLYGEAGYKDRADAAAEIERLRAIVDRLPKTADGASIVNGDRIYEAPCTISGRVVEHSVQHVDDDGWLVISDDGSYEPPIIANLSRCYSTREAAEAAAEEVQP